MALIACPNCGKEISDKARVCPSCGTEMSQETPSQNEEENITCEECGVVYEKRLSACPNCGCPVQIHPEDLPQKVEVTNVKLKIDSRKRNIAIIIALVVVVVIGACVYLKSYTDKRAAEKTAEEYKSTLNLVASDILSGAGNAETAGGLIHDVWYNSIYKEWDTTTDDYTRPDGYFVSDFNEALGNLFNSSSFKKQIDDITSNQETVQGLMKNLTNPPSEYDDAYDSAKNLYDAYVRLTNLAVSPSGNLQSYTSDYNDADSDVLNCYKALQLYLG